MRHFANRAKRLDVLFGCFQQLLHLLLRGGEQDLLEAVRALADANLQWLNNFTMLRILDARLHGSLLNRQFLKLLRRLWSQFLFARGLNLRLSHLAKMCLFNND